MDTTEKPIVDHASYKAEEFTDTPSAAEAQAEKDLLWKCDMRLLPPLMVIYFLSFMDRTNIGVCQQVALCIIHQRSQV